MKHEPERSYLEHVSIFDSSPILDATSIDPRAVPAFQILDDKPLAFSQYEAMVSRNHGIHETEIALFVPPYRGLVPQKILFDFLAVGSHYRKMKHLYSRFLDCGCEVDAILPETRESI